MLSALCALFVAPASAQEAVADLFTVAGVRVDETAADSRQAKAQAFARAQEIGFERLARRIASPESLALRGPPRLPTTALERMVIGLDIEGERFSGTRYIGAMAVRFDPTQARAALEGAGLQLAEARAQPLLVVPVSPPQEGFGPDAIGTAWRAAWERGGYEHELAPLLIAPPGAGGPQADWARVQPTAYQIGAAAALFATVQNSGSTATATLIEVGPNGRRIDRGSVTTPVGTDGLDEAYRRLADAASARLQADWRAQAVQTATAVRGRLTASALYQSQADWTRIKQALESLAQGAISEIRIEAIARDGAVVSFAFPGAFERAVDEFRRRGLVLAETPQGPVMRVAR
jgi:hypothetical protein